MALESKPLFHPEFIRQQVRVFSLPGREAAAGDENTEVRSHIDVDILGHIFEQSITDLERLRLGLE
jgi:hypothetical protein